MFGWELRVAGTGTKTCVTAQSFAKALPWELMLRAASSSRWVFNSIMWHTTGLLINMCMGFLVAQCRRPWFNPWVRKIPWRKAWLPTPVFLGSPGGSDSKESACNVGDLDLIYGLGRSLGGGHGIATHSNILAWRIPMDRGAWWATVPGVPKSWTWLEWLSIAQNSMLSSEKSFLNAEEFFFTPLISLSIFLCVLSHSLSYQTLLIVTRIVNTQYALIISVFICHGCHKTMLQPKWLKQHNLFSHNSGYLKSKIKVSAPLISSEAALLPLEMDICSPSSHGHHPPVWISLLISYYKDTSQCMRLYPNDLILNSLPI